MSARPEVVGHAGAGGFFPGNSLKAIEKALELRVDRIECDVQRSADGDLVLVHDEELNDARGKRPVKRITTAELRERLHTIRQRLARLVLVVRFQVAGIAGIDVAEAEFLPVRNPIGLGELARFLDDGLESRRQPILDRRGAGSRW